MRFGVLGPLAVWTAGGTPVRVPEAKVRALLADLLVDPGRPVPADRLVDDLWGARPPGSPANTLQTKVSQLRRALEEAEPGARELVAYGPAGYLLRIEPDAVDASRFAALLGRARGTGDATARAALLADALALWRGPAFADFGDAAFARPAITALEERRLTAREELAEVRLELGEHRELADELAELVALHPLRERLRAVHLRALYRTGRQTEALDGYAELRERLAGELGLDPGPELTALHQAILEHDPDLAPAPAARLRTNLPAALTSLIGRDEDVGQARALLGTARIVTLTGPGGVGKTRLAVATAAGLGGAFPDGICLVEFAGRHRPCGTGTEVSLDEVAEVVTEALGLRDHAKAEPADPFGRLKGALRARQMLLVLDNCEHLVEPVAALVEALLREAPDVRVLATSQDPLALSGEVLHLVPPLASPDAVRLFAERAAAAAPGFVLDDGNARSIAAICRRLDGIPLALELAATRVRALGVHRLAERLDDRFRLLATGRRDAPARQRTLRAMIDWSWELLSEPERIVLRRLAVHAGGCALEAAEAVCGGDGVPAGEVFELLARLVDRSLVVAAEDEDGPRYRLLESVAAYCLDRLADAGERDRVQARHDAYYTAFAEETEPRLYGPEQRLWLRRLDAEAANLRTTLDGAAQRGDAELAKRLAHALSWYWFLSGRHSEGQRLLTLVSSLGEASGRVRAFQVAFTLLTGDADDQVPQTRAALRVLGPADGAARAEWFLGFAHFHFGDLAISEELVGRALTAARASGDTWTEAAALNTKATQALFRGDLATLERDGTRSSELFDRLGDRWGRLQVTENLGNLAEVTGDYERAARLHREGVRIAEELGLRTEVSYRLSELGRIALLDGDHARARELHERARRMAVEQSSPAAEEFAEVGLGMTARRDGRFADADAHLRNWLAWNRRLGSDIGLALVAAELGFVAEQRGDAEQAWSLHLEGLACARRTGGPRAVALAFEGLAGAHALAGRHGEAARLLGAAAAARASVGAPLPAAERADVDRVTARAQAALGDAAFEAHYEDGAQEALAAGPGGVSERAGRA